ncbi:unnamed protein product [Fusarium venenatum]|uniref:Uncharacterized protein n=1 Tax=Fusarium venenatum TaxID=56646 RepID=A0A2L2TWW7_9HYPO|nr:uncharacterized protein FVRRES_09133 [Fusarium venenatum]CEI69056.1 unnamed protein product [Fusarium venenatum]
MLRYPSDTKQVTTTSTFLRFTSNCMKLKIKLGLLLLTVPDRRQGLGFCKQPFPCLTLSTLRHSRTAYSDNFIDYIGQLSEFYGVDTDYCISVVIRLCHDTTINFN